MNYFKICSYELTTYFVDYLMLNQSLFTLLLIVISLSPNRLLYYIYTNYTTHIVHILLSNFSITGINLPLTIYIYPYIETHLLSLNHFEFKEAQNA